MDPGLSQCASHRAHFEQRLSDGENGDPVLMASCTALLDPESKKVQNMGRDGTWMLVSDGGSDRLIQVYLKYREGERITSGRIHESLS